MEKYLSKLRLAIKAYEQDVDAAFLIFSRFKKILEEASKELDAKEMKKLSDEAVEMLGNFLKKRGAKKEVVADYMRELRKYSWTKVKAARKPEKIKTVEKKVEKRVEGKPMQEEREKPVSSSKIEPSFGIFDLLALLLIGLASLFFLLALF